MMIASEKSISSNNESGAKKYKMNLYLKDATQKDIYHWFYYPPNAGHGQKINDVH